MPADSVPRTVSVERLATGRLAVRNSRGGVIAVGNGSSEEFTPTELLLAAIGGCTAIDVDVLTSRRAEPTAFDVVVEATKVRDDSGNRLSDITVTFRLEFPLDDAGDRARQLLPTAVRMSHDRLCTVGRTVENGSPISTVIE